LIEKTLQFIITGLPFLGIAALYRAFKGPSTLDRVVAMNMISAMVIVYILIFSYLTEAYFYLDVVLVFNLAAFIATLCVLKYLREGRLF
jgi:multicomponent Na+:H+ antiporter subunit F